MTALEEVIKEGVEDLVEEAGALPELITAIDGLMGGITPGEVVPGGIVSDLPEDGPSASLRTGLGRGEDRWVGGHLPPGNGESDGGCAH